MNEIKKGQYLKILCQKCKKMIFESDNSVPVSFYSNSKDFCNKCWKEKVKK
jgi:hypothetical protein